MFRLHTGLYRWGIFVSKLRSLLDQSSLVCDPTMDKAIVQTQVTAGVPEV